jgi:hypothetical protein
LRAFDLFCYKAGADLTMNRIWTRVRVFAPALVALAALAAPAPLSAGGAWVPEPGDGTLTLGYSKKHAASSWDAFGNAFDNGTQHDFRYAYLDGDVGLFRNLSAQFLLTFLDGREGPPGDLERNVGFSDAWFGLKYQLKQGSYPMALGANLRTPMFYDREGPYNRYVFNNRGEIAGLNDEWRGLLKYDYTLAYYVSHSFLGGAGWANFWTGYTWRTGAPADQIPAVLEAGYPLPWFGATVKGQVLWAWSLHNDSPRQPDDRFGGNATFSFNDASLGRVGAGLIIPIPLGPRHRWNVEVGYNKWIWGRSARRYQEPYLSIGYGF